MGSRFFDQAKRLFSMESGRASLPTVQALALLFTVSAYIGKDREGMVYRYTALEMLKRLGLERRLARLKDDDPTEAREKRAISKAIWGLFCFERYVQ